MWVDSYLLEDNGALTIEVFVFGPKYSTPNWVSNISALGFISMVFSIFWILFNSVNFATSLGIVFGLIAAPYFIIYKREVVSKCDIISKVVFGLDGNLTAFGRFNQQLISLKRSDISLFELEHIRMVWNYLNSPMDEYHIHVKCKENQHFFPSLVFHWVEDLAGQPDVDWLVAILNNILNDEDPSLPPSKYLAVGKKKSYLFSDSKDQESIERQRTYSTSRYQQMESIKKRYSHGYRR